MRTKDQAEHAAELRGLSLGILADGRIVQSEAEFLADWLDRHVNPATTEWAILQLAKRVRAMLADGDFSSDEAVELQQLLRRLLIQDNTAPSGGSGKRPPFDPYHQEGTLELVSPRSDIFDTVEGVTFNSRFCFTGIFAFGDRRDCEKQTRLMGGEVVSNPYKDDCYLVVGSIASPDWKFGRYGKKIDKALDYRTKGGSITIISEDVWANALATS